MGFGSQISKLTLALIASTWAALAVAQAPSIASYNSWHGVAGDSISISGSNLDTVTAIYFNGVPSASVTIDSTSSIHATVPVGATTGKLKAVNPSGEYTTSSDFVVDGTDGGGGGTGGGTGGDSGDSSSTVVIPPDIELPVGASTVHPRIFIRKTDLTRLRSWATPPIRFGSTFLPSLKQPKIEWTPVRSSITVTAAATWSRPGKVTRKYSR